MWQYIDESGARNEDHGDGAGGVLGGGVGRGQALRGVRVGDVGAGASPPPQMVQLVVLVQQFGLLGGGGVLRLPVEAAAAGRHPRLPQQVVAAVGDARLGRIVRRRRPAPRRVLAEAGDGGHSLRLGAQDHRRAGAHVVGVVAPQKGLCRPRADQLLALGVEEAPGSGAAGPARTTGAVRFLEDALFAGVAVY